MDLNILPKSKNIAVLDKIIKGCIYTLVFLIPLWFLSATVNVLDFNKQTLIVFLTVIAFILWLAKLLSQEELRWKKSKLNLAVLGFLLVYILATVFSLHPYDSLMGFSTHLSGGLINILSLVGLYFLIINSFKKEGDRRRLVFTFLGSSVIASLFGLLQILNVFVLPFSFLKTASFNTIGTVNSLGIFAAISLIFSISLLLVKKLEVNFFKDVPEIGVKVFLWIFSAINFLILITLNFWVLWAVLGVGIFVLLILQTALRNIKITSLVPIMVFLVFVLFFTLFKPALPISTNLPTEISLSHQGSMTVVTEVIKERPVLGSGPEGFIYNYAKYKPTSINQTAFWNTRFTNPAAEIFSLASDSGILGLLSFLLMIGLAGYLAIKKILDTDRKDKLNIGLFSVWVALIAAWVLYPQNLTLIFLFWFFLALLVIDFSDKEGKLNFGNSSKIALAVSLGFVVMILVFVSLFYLQGTKYLAEMKYKDGLTLVQAAEGLDAGINRIVQSTTINARDDKAFRSLAQLFLAKANQDLTNTELDKEEREDRARISASNAINSAVRATELNPLEMSNWLVRGDVYKKLIGFIGSSEKWAEVAFKQALGLEPLNPFVHTEIGRIYVTIADILTPEARTDNEIKEKVALFLAEAQKYFDKAIEAKEDYSPAHFEMALVYDRQGRIEEAIDKMEKNLEFAPNDLGVAFQLSVLYYKNSQFDKAKTAFQQTLMLDPNFSNARYFLGLLYEKDGQIEKAIQEFEAIAELNPGNENIEVILENLRTGKPALGSPELGPPGEPQEVPIEEATK